MSYPALMAVATVALLAAGATAAQEALPPEFYLKGFAGLTFGQDAPLDPGGWDTTFDYDYGAGASFGLALGMQVTPSWALEIEGARRVSEAEVDASIDLGPGDGIDRWTFDETVRVDSLMANLVYRPPAGQGDRFTPYVGAGLGRARIEFGQDDTDWEPAWQIFAGVARPLAPRLDLLGEVRWFQAEGGIFEELGEPFEIGGDYRSIDVTLGLAYRF